jgi:hypothetical protein
LRGVNSLKPASLRYDFARRNISEKIWPVGGCDLTGELTGQAVAMVVLIVSIGDPKRIMIDGGGLA